MQIRFWGFVYITYQTLENLCTFHLDGYYFAAPKFDMELEMIF